MKRFFGKPEAAWLIGTVVACAFLAAAIFLPLWRMELIAPQYPDGLAIWAYGNRFVGDTTGYYEGFDTLLEINNLNHYIGMKPIEEVWAMDIFVPGLILTMAGALAVSFIAWHRNWFRALIITAFWVIPISFAAILQYYLWYFGHTMDENAALAMDPFTPRIVGTTSVWNFHTNNSLGIGFYLMIAAAMSITFLPLLIRAVQGRRQRHRIQPTISSAASQATSTSAGGRTA